MNKYFIGFISVLLPSIAQANMGQGAEGFFILLLNNYLLAAVFLAGLVLAFFKYFKTTLRRNIFIGLNIVPVLITLASIGLMLQDGANIIGIWWLIIAMLLGHVFSIAIPYIQYNILTKHNA